MIFTKRFARLLLYIALAGFIFTAIANLAHRPDIAKGLLVVSCISILLGCFIFLLFPVYIRNEQKMHRVRKIGTILVYISLFGVIIAVILSILHVSRDVYRSIITVSLFCALSGYIVLLVAPLKTIEISKSVLNPVVYRRAMMVKVLAYLFIICILSGMLLKINHYSGGEFVLMFGLILSLVYFSALIYHRNASKKRPLLNTQTIELTSSELDVYLGQYYNAQMNMYITVTRNENGKSLIAQATGQNAFPLNAIEKNIFNYDRAGIVMEFKPEKNEFILIQSGGYFPFIKQ